MISEIPWLKKLKSVEVKDVSREKYKLVQTQESCTVSSEATHWLTLDAILRFGVARIGVRVYLH